MTNASPQNILPAPQTCPGEDGNNEETISLLQGDLASSGIRPPDEQAPHYGPRLTAGQLHDSNGDTGGSSIPNVDPAMYRSGSNGDPLAHIEPISFPPTEDGFHAKVRWYSFQFVMDELVEELEEAFLSVSCVLEQLPYPIR